MSQADQIDSFEMGLPTQATLTSGESQINGQTSGLKVLIVGAGIGGLAAAIQLVQQGHDVEIFESSRFATETGAAIHMAPNANGLLKKLGITAASIGANKCLGLTSWAAHGMQLSDIPFHNLSEMWQHDWILSHRVRLHNALKVRATTQSTDIKNPAKLHLSSPVANVDPQTGEVFLQDGRSVKGDVIIGADGVHSITRHSLPGNSGDTKAYSSGKSAFRFLVPKEDLLNDPDTKKYVARDGVMHICYGRDRRIVMYPTNDNTLMNFVAIHPESESDSTATGDWNNTASKELLLKVYKDFSPDWLKILSKADGASLKVWKLLDMGKLDTWINGRLALLGDAAHPFLPHQGQGGGQAIEDAVALATVLERNAQAESIPERLRLYESIRKERAEKIQHYSRIAGEDNLHPKEAATIMMEFTAYNYGHSEDHYSSQRLREWKWSQQPASYWRMPKAFGPMPGPRQDVSGQPRDGTESTFTTASIKIKTSRTVLQTLFPPGSTSWRFKSPGTIAYCSFSQTTLNGMEWLGGTGYNHLGLYIHGVEYTKEDGSTVSGTYMPILFESLADPIVSGREELGMPKLFSSIDIERDSSSYHIRASWQGMTWGRFELNNLRELPYTNGATGKIAGDTTDEGILVHRVIPAVGRENKSKVDAEYVVFDAFSSAEPKPKVQKTLKSSDASFKLLIRDRTALPTIHHIVERLAEIPVYGVVSAQVVEGTGVPDVSGACRV